MCIAIECSYKLDQKNEFKFLCELCTFSQIRSHIIFNENGFGKSTDANELELDKLKETVAEMPIESEKEESEQEIDEQSEPLRHSKRVSRPPVHYGIDLLLQE